MQNNLPDKLLQDRENVTNRHVEETIDNGVSVRGGRLASRDIFQNPG